jgi:hypothetical protein
MSDATLIPDIHVLHSADALDHRLADTVAASLHDLPAKPVLLPAEKLVAQYRERRQIPVVGHVATIVPGDMVVVLSETLLRDAAQREAMIAAADGTSLVDFRHYYICRGITPEEVRARFPDLALIYENVLLRSEDELPAVLEDIKRSFTKSIPTFKEHFGRGIVMILGTSVALALSRLGHIYTFRLVLATGLALLLYVQGNATLTAVLVAACFYTVGLGMSRIRPLDLWPWPGRCWRWPVSPGPRRWLQPVTPIGPLAFAGAACGAAAAMLTGHRDWLWKTLIGAVALQAVIDTVCMRRELARIVRLAAGEIPDPPKNETTCDPAQLHAALTSWLAVRLSNLMKTFAPLVVVAIIAAIGAMTFSKQYALAWLAAFAAGALAPTIIAATWLAADREVIRSKGLTTQHLARIGQTYRDVGVDGVPFNLGVDDEALASFDEAQKNELRRFAFHQRIGPDQSFRPWFTPHDFAFISYVWSDEATLNLAERLDGTLAAAGIPSFRDKRGILDPYAAWREEIALALTRCTHFFIIVSPGIKTAQVVLREIQTVVYRWRLEMSPAVICIADPNDVPTLRNDPKTDLNVRFLLSCCPYLTPEAATDARQVREIVEYTRRQGKWKDWGAMMSLAAARHQILMMPGIVRDRQSGH